MNKPFTTEEITKLADKLLIGVSSKEAEEIIDELNFVKDSMNVIEQIEGIDKIEPLTHPFDLFETQLREDNDFTQGDEIEDLLANADRSESREIEVPKVVG